MERLIGESLASKLERELVIELRDLATLMAPVVSAVGTAHAVGVVRRDLKPENIFLARAPAAPADSGAVTPKVLDFGIARVTTLDDDAMRSTGVTTGVVVGTPAYMAPEQVFAESDIDQRVDIWALGLILYRGLSGVLPTRLRASWAQAGVHRRRVSGCYPGPSIITRWLALNRIDAALE
jgi:eukaryotic-like serine/threonine-protein kinase